MLAIKDVYKTYGNVEALKGLSFKIDKGIVFGLLGPNGSGKTTTIRIILSIIYPDKGTIEMDFKRIGYMPEERGLYPDMRIDELIDFFGRLKGMKKENIRKQMDYWLDRLELSDRKKDKVQELSKGLKQRLHLLLSVIHDPDLLILDEPFIGLDPIAVKGLRDLVQELKEKGKTILLSTHWMDQAEQLCDYVCLIKNGEKVYTGQLEKLRDAHRRNEVYLEIEGEVDFDRIDQIQDVRRDNKGFIIKIEGSYGEFLRNLSTKTDVLEFRLLYPSLEEIFIEELKSG